MEELKKVFGNTISQVVVRFSGSVTTFIVTLLIVSRLGISSLGIFIAATTFVALFYLLIDFGLNTIYLKDYFKKAEDYFGNLLLLRLILASLIFTFILLFALGGFAKSFNSLGVVIYSFTLFTEAILVSFTGLTQKKLIQKVLVYPSVISSVVTLGIVYWGATHNNLALIFAAYPIGESVQVLMLFLLVRRSVLFNIIPESFYSFSKTAVITSIPIALMLFLNVLYFRVDTLLLSIYKSPAEVGAYGFAYKVFEFLLVFPSFFSASVFPILIAHKERPFEFYKKTKQYGLILLGASVVIGVFVFVLSPFITVIRNDLSLAILPLQILVFSLPFFFITSLLQWVLLLRGQVRFLVLIYLITLILNIILNVVYIPKFGSTAASTITVITEGAVFLLMIPLFRITTYKKSSKPNDK